MRTRTQRPVSPRWLSYRPNGIQGVRCRSPLVTLIVVRNQSLGSASRNWWRRRISKSSSDARPPSDSRGWTNWSRHSKLSVSSVISRTLPPVGRGPTQNGRSWRKRALQSRWLALLHVLRWLRRSGMRDWRRLVRSVSGGRRLISLNRSLAAMR